MNVLVFILRCMIQSKVWFVFKTFDIVPVRLKALKISERWCDCGMDKRSICQGRLGTNSLKKLVNDNSIPIKRLNASRSFFDFIKKTLRGFHFEHNHATMRCSRARATTPSLSLYNVIHACAAAFFSFSLALALRTRASSSSSCCAQAPPPAGRARSHPTFSA